MKAAPIFTGAATALVTPLNRNGIDYAAMDSLINWQIDQGINALVIAGTTGEGSTLTDEEHRDVIRHSVQVVDHRIPVIAGTGSNDTDYAISLTRFACEAGADAMLVVTPYYNKATQNGLVRMYTEIADASTKPLILYNVPSRTGVNIEPKTYAALADHPMIQGIKEASGNFSKILETRALIGDKLDLYSGNDDQIVPILSLGGLGVISVLSNVAPAMTVEICSSFLNGDTRRSLDLQTKASRLIQALFCEVNPIPVKAAVAAMGYGENYLRLPLTPMEAAHEEILLREMRNLDLI